MSRVIVVPDLVRHDNHIHVTRRGLLRFSEFRKFLSGQFLGQVADAMTTVVVGKALFLDDAAGSAGSRLLHMALIAALPLILAGPFAGVITDRCSRRKILVIGQSVRAVLCLVILHSIFRHDHGLLAVLFGVQMCVSRVLYTVRAASVRHLVRQHELVAADSLLLIVGPVAASCGAALSVSGSHLVGAWILIGASAMSFLSSWSFARGRSVLGGGRDHHTAPWPQVVQHLQEQKTRYAVLSTSLHRLFFGMTYASAVLLLETEFRNAGTAYAVVLSASGAGSFFGSITAEWVNELMPRKSLAVIAFGISGAATYIALSLQIPIAFGGFALLVSFLFQNLRICSDATVQSNATPGAGGREFALYDLSYNTMFVVGLVLAVSFNSVASPALLLRATAGLFAAGAILVAILPRGHEEKRIAISSPSTSSNSVVRSHAV